MEYLLILIFNYIFLIYFLSHKFMKLCVKWACEFQIIEIDHFMRYGKNRWWPFTFPNVSFPPSCMKNISWEGIPSIESPMIEFCSMYYLLQYIRIPCKFTLHIFISYTIEWIEFLDGDVCTKCIVVGQSYNLSQNRNWKDTIEIFSLQNILFVV